MSHLISGFVSPLYPRSHQISPISCIVRNFRYRNYLNLEKKSNFQMGFEPRTLLTACSNLWATADSMVKRDEMWVFDWGGITWSHSQMMTCTYELTNCITQSHQGISKMKPTTFPWLECPVRSWRVVSSNPRLDFSFGVNFRYLVSH